MDDNTCRRCCEARATRARTHDTPPLCEPCGNALDGERELMRMAAEQTADLKQARERNSRARKTTGSHGMTRLQAATLLREQGGRCQICDHVLTTHRRAHRRRCDDAEPIMAVVDHCHETGAIRGMLCCSCNQGLGFLKDNPDWMRKAIEYLTRGS